MVSLACDSGLYLRPVTGVYLIEKAGFQWYRLWRFLRIQAADRLRVGRIVGGGVGVNEKRSSHPGGATIEESDGEFALPSVTSLRPRIQKKLRSGANSAPRGGSLRWIERRPSQRVLRESPARTMQGSLAC